MNFASDNWAGATEAVISAVTRHNGGFAPGYGGDPLTKDASKEAFWGTGDPGYKIKAEFNPMPHVRGTLSMARAASDDSANSQFFIVFYPRFSLDKKYTNFGRVIENMEAVDAINRGEPPATPTYILQASLASDNLPPPPPPAPAQDAPISADMLSAPIP